MGMADVLLVNSNFTETVFRKTFSSLAHRRLFVLYPSLNIDFFEKEESKQSRCDDSNSEIEKLRIILENSSYIFLSINRFEVKKNVELAVRAFGNVLQLKIHNM